MRQQSRWAKRLMKCPEGRGESALLVEWRLKKDGEVVNSVSCNNLQLIDLSGRDCQWSCWEKISLDQGK
jgi:hypothetical protein